MSQLVQQNNITDLIKSQMPAIALVMNGTSERERKIKAERFARICLTAVRKNPKLMKCSQESFAAALMNCAQLNLEPNTPQELAYLISNWIQRVSTARISFWHCLIIQCRCCIQG